MRVLGIVFALLFAATGVAMATDPVPEKRLVLSRDVDFYGSDVQSLFDTTYQACSNACLANSQCRALTFNTRSNACFLKSDVSQEQPYQGALSAKILITAPQVLNTSKSRAAELSFLSQSDLSAAGDLALTISDKFSAGNWTLDQLVPAAAEARSSGNIQDAILYTGSAITLSDAPDMWTEYARLMLVRPSDNNTRTRYRTEALQASIAAYLRAVDPGPRVNALVVMADALESRNRGRDMIPALRLAQATQPRAEVADALDSAVAKYGFRITEHQVDSDAASPRVCATFSEEVLSGGSDYASYVTLDQQEPVVTSEGRQICVEGLTHGSRYRVTFRPGLMAASGEALSKPVTLNLYVRDRSAAVRFPGRGYILPASGDVALPIIGVNVSTVDLRLRKVSDRNLIRSIQNDYFGRPLGYYAEEYFASEIAEDVWKGTGDLSSELNRDVTTRLPLGEVVKGLTPGIYVLQASVPGQDPYENPAATQWFVVSDLALTSMSGNDGLHVFVRSLATAEAKVGAKVTLLSRSNAVLASAQSDAQGYVRFDAGLARGTGGAAPAMLTVEQGADDLAFLPLTDPEFDLSDRGVEGREPAPPIDVFLATDRGAYRAGEVIHVTALTRDSRAMALEGLPLTAVLYRPDGVEYSRNLSPGGVVGGHVFALPVAGSAPRGTWRLDLFSDPNAPALASNRLLVEDFLPERIDFDLSLPDGVIRATDTPPLTIEARYLFGAPGADLSIEGETLLRQIDTLDAFPGYVFGRHDQPVSAQVAGLPYDTRTDADGKAVLNVELPVLDAVTGPLEARVTVRLAEGSGRPVERRLTRQIAAPTPVIGIKPAFDDVLPEGAMAEFSLIALDPVLQPTPMKVHWTINRVETRYQWYSLYGEWNWEPTSTRTRVSTGEAVLGQGPVQVSAPVTWGNYEIRVESTEGTYATSSTDFWAGWYTAADATSTPDTLDVSLDKAAYLPGETAQLRLVPRFAGKALVTVMSDRLIAMQAVDVTEGENMVAIPVTDDWGAGAYVTATVIRPMDVAAGHNPARALGLSYAKVDPGQHQLNVSVETAAEATPRGPMPISVHVDGIAPGETAYVTLAAVDLGILNLTGFDSPDPSDHYFGQRKLGMGLRDVYGRLIDGMNGQMGAVRSGGDAMAELAMDNPPPTEELVAYFSGPLTVGADGLARTSFDLPSFNGTVRLMAVAWSNTGVGQAEQDVLVRDPVVVTASLPRFLAPGDQSRLLLEIVHATGPAGRIGLDITGDGVTLDRRAIPSGVDLAQGGKANLSIPLVAGAVGLHQIAVNLTTPDGQQLTKVLTVPVQQLDPEISRTSRFTLAASQTFTLDSNVFDGLLPGTAKSTLAVGPLARLDAPGLLATLDRYPYGCTEQITSRALPLLYLDEVAVAIGLSERDTLSTRIDQAITAVLANQSSNGGFGLWYPSSGDLWLDTYVTDFLSRARSQGYAVPDLAFRQAVDNLRNQVNYAADFDSGGEDIAYALLVLAREGAAAIGDLRYYADQKGDAFLTPLAAAQLGAALAAYGDPTRADQMFARAATKIAGLTQDETDQVWRSDYGTNLRDAAGVLTLAVEAGSNVIDRDTLAARVAQPQATRPLSTQESVWSLLAAHALLGDQQTQGITINGQPVNGPLVRVIEDQTEGGRALAVSNSSGRETTLTLTTYGVPSVSEPKGGNGYAIDRDYFTMNGEPVSPDGVAVGTRLVTVLTIQPFGKAEARLMVNDPLPAGFEIDNPNLLTGGAISALDWLDLSTETQNAQFRQDRFLAAVDWRSSDSFRLAYIVRAISPGVFHHPAASVEDMYRPQYRARTGTETIRIGQ